MSAKHLSTTAGPEAALSVEDVDKTFAGVTVLSGVSLHIERGSVHALAGHNGSGKSTLIKILAGFHGPDTAAVATSFGHEFDLGDHSSAASAGLRFVHQDLGLVDTLSTIDNLALDAGYPSRGGLISWKRAARRSQDAVHNLGYDFDVRKPVGQLTAAERTGVAIARALQDWKGEPSVVVLDEPTAVMPADQTHRLFAAVRQLQRRGLGILYVTHHLDEILDLADHVTVLRAGNVVLSEPAQAMTHRELVVAITGREPQSGHLTKAASSEDERRRTHRHQTQPDAERPSSVLRVDELSTNLVEAASFTVAPGEILGFAGLAGSGREDILPALAGASRRRGTVQVDGRTVRSHSPRAAIRAGVNLVPSDRSGSALLPTMSAGENLTVSGLRRYSRAGILLKRREVRDVQTAFQTLDVQPPRPEAPVLTLSGGNQQKVVLGRWLRCDPRVLALDEPTQGVDIGARHSIYQAVRAIAASDNAVVVSSVDSNELATLCDRVLVFVRGRLAAELTGDALNAHQIDHVALDETSGVNA